MEVNKKTTNKKSDNEWKSPLDRTDQDGLPKKVTYELSPEGRAITRQRVWGGGGSRENRKGKGPEAGKGWAYSRNRGKTSGWNGEIKEVDGKQIRKGLAGCLNGSVGWVTALGSGHDPQDQVPH